MVFWQNNRENKAVSPQAKRGTSVPGLAAAHGTFWQEGGFHPSAGLTGVVVLAFTPHFETHFLIQECIRHTEVTLTPFLGLDVGAKENQNVWHTISDMWELVLM